MNKEMFLYVSFGYLMITDVLIFSVISIYLKNRYNLNDFFVLIGIILGVSMSFYRLFKFVLKNGKKDG